ncbi:MAG: hypothetical protein ACO1N7_01260 [Sphingobacteriaceae bacterium]
MKNNWIVLLLILLLSACRANYSRHTPSSPPIINDQYRGLYIDSVSYILGDTLKEYNLLRWCQRHQINSLSYYDLKRVMTTGKAGHLASFLKLARSNYGIKENTAIVGSEVFVNSYLDTFNRSKPDTLQRFNAINLEREWWNHHGSFESYVTVLGKLNRWAKAQNPAVLTEEYIGWFKNPKGQELNMANALLKNSDRILLHAYQEHLTFNYVLSRLSYLGRAAESQNKVFPVVIIFSAEPKFMASYFKKHSFKEAYQIIVKGYENTSFPGKNNIKLIGYQLFDYSYMKAARN